MRHRCDQYIPILRSFSSFEELPGSVIFLVSCTKVAFRSLGSIAWDDDASANAPLQLSIISIDRISHFVVIVSNRKLSLKRLDRIECWNVF